MNKEIALADLAAARRLHEKVEMLRPDVIGLCQELIRMPSEDPGGDTCSVCSHLEQLLRSSGAEVQVIAAEKKKPNLVATFDFGAGGSHVVLNGHMETLPIGDLTRWKHPPLEGKIDSGRIYGRGVRCMKGGIAAAAQAALGVARAGHSNRGRITLMFVSDEVNGGELGTKYVLERLPDLRPDAVLVAESNSGIAIGHKGALFVRVRTVGEGGHGAYSFSRRSANGQMADLLQELRRLELIETPESSDLRSLLAKNRGYIDARNGNGTADNVCRCSMNVGVLRGGSKVNVIAEECSAEVDIRIPPEVPSSRVLDALEKVCARHEGASFEVLWLNEATLSPIEHPWIRCLQAHSRLSHGAELPLGYTNGFTDARFFQLSGIPAAAVGIDGAGIGAPDEYLEIESLIAAMKLFASSSAQFAGNGPKEKN
ncbi:M20/M25/M40 family metallo-hydrolase [Bradyrhizobium sp. RT11b]|uniref:M20 family metallopeptidase n=1 Tax=Bradyrhizobium sp. RT11b TaxID=3156332 RepID=UPI00339984DC